MSDQMQNKMLASLKGMEERTLVSVPPKAEPAAPVQQLKRMTMIVSAELHTRLKMHAVSQYIHLEDIYREALEDYAVKHGLA